MESVVREVSFEQAFVVHDCAEVVEIDQIVGGTVIFQPAVQCQNPVHRPLRIKILRLRRVVVDREDRRKDHRNFVGPRQVSQGCQVRFNVFVRDRSRIARNVVGSGKYYNGFRLKINYVLPKAHQHLRGGLPADAAIDVRLAGKRIGNRPNVGDRVAEEHDPILSWCGRLQRCIGTAITRKLPVVVRVNRNSRCAIFVQTGKSGCWNSDGICWRLGRSLSPSRRPAKHCAQ